MTSLGRNSAPHRTTINETVLPTLSSPDWSIAGFRDSISRELPNDEGGTHLRMLFYAATMRGWNGIRKPIEQWLSKKGRLCTAYIGTDHAITDPDALVEMQKTISVRLLVEYEGIYHPKVVWCQGTQHTFWIGSNNLTEGGLRRNIECAVMIRSPAVPPSFAAWFEAVETSSVAYDATLVSDYRTERDEFQTKHGSGGAFTWSQRREPTKPPVQVQSGSIKKTSIKGALTEPAGQLVVQVMPRETGPGGKQLQFPIAAIADFFGIPSQVGASRSLTLRSLATGESKQLTMTVYENRTARLSISELDYGDRPCVIVFSRDNNSYVFEIVQQSISPDRYRRLINACRRPTRSGSRRWLIT